MSPPRPRRPADAAGAVAGGEEPDRSSALAATGAVPAGETAAAAPLLRGLNAAQREAVTTGVDPLRILAGAGSGKTRVLTHRIAYRATTGSLDPDRVLAVTFTRKAAGELRDRLARLGLRGGVNAGTFHSIAYAQLRQRWEERGIRPPELLDRKVGFVARLMRAQRGSTAPLDVVAELEWAAARRVGPEEYEAAAARARRDPPVPLGRVADVYQRYQSEKRRRRLVDFDDLLRLAVRDLSADPVYASTRHWRFRHVVVDEFQDVNPLQFALLSAWLGPESDLCVVGDPNQAIYAWNGADARYLLDFDRYFPGGGSITLEDNYRSTPQVLEVANAVLHEGQSVPIRLRPHRPPGAAPTVTEHPDATTEAAAIARRARDLHAPGRPWSAQSVLVRTNAQAALVAEAFGAASIPHRIRGGGDLMAQPEVRSAIAAIRRAPSLQMALADLDAQVRRADPDGTLSAGGSTAGPGDPDVGPPELGPSPEAMTDDRLANLAELVRLGREYVGIDPDGDVAGFTGWLTSALRGEDAAVGDAVDIVTFHAAKGLEWSVVHVGGLEEGFVPIHHAKDDPEALEEERRLLYVALTRARDELHCSWARSREFGSRTLNRSPSPWLVTVAAAAGTPPPQVPRAEGAARARSARAALAAGRSGLDEGDRRVFDALRAWRRDRARESDVPAYVVFNDATLTELARRQPRTRAELLAVPGIGPVKAQRFGDEVLAIISSP